MTETKKAKDPVPEAYVSGKVLEPPKQIEKPKGK